MTTPSCGRKRDAQSSCYRKVFGGLILNPHEWPEDQDERAAIRKDFSGKYGDRRQELVFIGIEMQRSLLEFELNNCLLTDEEFECGPSVWSAFNDPFPEQAPETE